MKGNKKVLAVALLLLLVAVSFGTYALYKSSVSGTATVQTAKWSAVIKKSVDGTVTNLTNSFALTGEDFVCTGGNSKVAGKIAPGDTCTATFVADLDGSEVDAKVGATVDFTNVPTGITPTLKNGGTALTSGQEIAVGYSSTEGGMEKTFTVELVWTADLDGATDTPLQDSTIVIPVTLVAHQDMGA